MTGRCQQTPFNRARVRSLPKKPTGPNQAQDGVCAATFAAKHGIAEWRLGFSIDQRAGSRSPAPHPQCTRVTHHVLDDRDPSKKKSPQVSPPGLSLMRESPFGLRMRKAERALLNTLMRFASTACRLNMARAVCKPAAMASKQPHGPRSTKSSSEIRPGDDARQAAPRKRRLHSANACLLIGEPPGACGRRPGVV